MNTFRCGRWFRHCWPSERSRAGRWRSLCARSSPRRGRGCDAGDAGFGGGFGGVGFAVEDDFAVAGFEVEAVLAAGVFF